MSGDQVPQAKPCRLHDSQFHIEDDAVSDSPDGNKRTHYRIHSNVYHERNALVRIAQAAAYLGSAIIASANTQEALAYLDTMIKAWGEQDPAYHRHLLVQPDDGRWWKL